MLVIKKFRDLFEANTFLQGGIIGGQCVNVGNLDGKTITFKSPAAATVTFSSPGGSLSFAEIKAQIESAVAGLQVNQFGGRIVLVESTPSSGVEILASSAGGHATMIGTVDLNTLDYGPGGTVDGKTIRFEINTVAQVATTFVAPTNRQAVLDQINANLVGATASINKDNFLVVATDDIGSTKKVKVLSGDATTDLGLVVLDSVLGAATNQANAALGLSTTGDKNVVYGGSGEAAPSLDAYNKDESMHMLVVKV